MGGGATSIFKPEFFFVYVNIFFQTTYDVYFESGVLLNIIHLIFSYTDILNTPIK